MQPTRNATKKLASSPKCKKASATSEQKKQGFSPRSKATVLKRTTFKTSREMDFFSKKELVTQTGHIVDEWPLVILKELIDNALDACEEGDIAPVIEVSADATGITILDNGPGLPEDTLQGAIDFTSRTSNREAYVSPCRGAQGNALKTILPMARVADPEHGQLIIETLGKRHTIRCGCDPISQRAVVHHDIVDLPKCKNRASRKSTINQALSCGTSIRIEWGARPKGEWPFGYRYPYEDNFARQFRELIQGLVVFNPHLTMTLNWFNEQTTWEATDPAWNKWKPHKPTSAHWYELAHLERLIGAYITHDRDHHGDRLVSDLVAEFDGLTGSQKRSKVLEDAGCHRVKLSDLVVGGRLDSARISRLLKAIQVHTRPVKPSRLGIIGEDHLRARLLAMGIVPESFQYSRKVSKNGLPSVLESAFGWKGDESEDRRTIISGANWSAAIKNPFRSFGATGEGLESALTDMRVSAYEPVVFVLHMAHPRVEYTDRGKSSLVVNAKKQDLS
jgi:DNA topoisomerase VI subunit B